MKKLIFSLIILLAYAGAFAQSGVLDGVYVKEHTPERKVIPYTHLREADVMWSKRVWRILDLREKINHPLYFPTQRIQNRRCLMQVIFDGIQEGTITPYMDENGDCEFKVQMTKAEAMAKLNPPPDTLQVENPDSPGEFISKIVPKEFKPADYKKFRMKEDWFFDKQRSVLDVRIIGMAPVVTRYADDGSEKGDAIPFWIYFPECRYAFANVEVYNRQNDAERRTLEDIFWKRMFGSYIYKETNVFDRIIDEYAQGIDALMESERIKEEIFLLEHDLWEL
jgi:gliding motility associated protien GldN